MTDRRPRVLLLTPHFWPEVRRGTERVVADLATRLPARGMQARVLAGAPRPGRAAVEGVRVLRVPRLPPPRPRRRFGELQGHEPLLHLALAATPADLVHAFHAADADVARRLRRRPLVWSHMGIPDRADLARVGPRAVRRVADEATAVVVLSRFSAAALRATLGREAIVIPPGVDLGVFRPAPARWAEPAVLCVADATDPRKRVGLLVEAWPRVRRSRPDATLLLDARTAAAVIDLDDPPAGIRPIRVDDTSRLAEAAGRAWAAALPSVSEAFGLVLAEALACGTPVVGAAAGGIPEVVDRPGIGTLFRGEADDLARAVVETLELAGDPATAGACRARAEELSVERTADAHATLYRSLL